MNIELDRIYNMDCLEGMRQMEAESIDLTVTSPPYDNLRAYNGYCFDFENIARELYRVTKQGGVVVWVVNDATINGNETGTSFKQALYFKECGFNLHDTMIWEKDTFTFPQKTLYRDVFEYMFILSKGVPKTINLISDRRNKYAGTVTHGTERNKDGTTSRKSCSGKIISEYGVRFNVWHIPGQKNNETDHPAVFPEKLARDHIWTWSNEGDIVLDPFMGSGTTAKVARALNRHYIGFEISAEYCDIIRKRLEQTKTLFDL